MPGGAGIGLIGTAARYALDAGHPPHGQRKFERVPGGDGSLTSRWRQPGVRRPGLWGVVWVDVVRESAGAGRVVLWEESARDGAQAKTLMTAGFRVWLARETGRVFGSDGPRHVVFAAGFPAVCGEEFEAVRRVAREAEGAVSVAAVCRGARRDLEQAVASVRGSRHARVMGPVTHLKRPPDGRCTCRAGPFSASCPSTPRSRARRR